MTMKNKPRIVIKDLPANRKITLKEMKAIHGGVMDAAEMDSSLVDTLLPGFELPDDGSTIARKRPGRVKY
ncbi:MAG: hypothetical protein JW932_15455 [Deltaproteobacteria bacterium]|nr:hypothetical protein [Deltaproteobacteria bacterium]